MGVKERFGRFMGVRPVKRLPRVRQPHREQMQHHRHPGDHRRELAPIHLGFPAGHFGLRDRDHPRVQHRQLGVELGAQRGNNVTAMRFRHHHTPLSSEAFTNPFRSVTLLAVHVTITDEHSANPDHFVAQDRQLTRRWHRLGGRNR